MAIRTEEEKDETLTAGFKLPELVEQLEEMKWWTKLLEILSFAEEDLE